MKYIRLAVVILIVVVSLRPELVNAAEPALITSGSPTSRVAPGGFLPVSVKLLNFGNDSRVDVIISYIITDEQGAVIMNISETVAVETTASFVKEIQIPLGTNPGRYFARSVLTYPDQVSPATSEFPFTVERKFFGLFQSDFYLYGGIVVLASIITGFVSHSWIRRRRLKRLTPVDYSNISGDQRVFYELISDTIMGMRQKVGEQASVIANNIDGLKIDPKTGRILKLTVKPSKIISELVSKYEKALGKKVSFSFRR